MLDNVYIWAVFKKKSVLRLYQVTSIARVLFRQASIGDIIPAQALRELESKSKLE